MVVMLGWDGLLKALMWQGPFQETFKTQTGRFMISSIHCIDHSYVAGSIQEKKLKQSISRVHQPIQSCSDVPFNWSTCNQRSDRRDCFSEKLLEIRVFKRRWPALIEFVWIRVAPCGFVCLHVFFRSPICNQALSSYFHILMEIEITEGKMVKHQLSS